MDLSPDFTARLEQEQRFIVDAADVDQFEVVSDDGFDSQVAAMREVLRIQYPGVDELTLEGMVVDRLCEMRRIQANLSDY